MSPLRFITPGQLLICLVLFFLPWIEMSCTLPPEATKNAPKEQLAEFKKKTGVDPTKPIGIVAQSGLQIATGDSSVASDFKKITDAVKKEAGAGGGMFKIDEDPSKEKQDKASHLFLYPVALIAGIVMALVPWRSPARKFIALGCCLLAFGVVGISAAVGFPMDKQVKKETEKMKDMGGMFGPPDGGQGKSSTKASDIIGVKWQFPLYLSLLLLIGAAATSVLGDRSAPAKRSKKKRRYRDEDEEEEEVLSLDDDEPEEKPKPRGRRGRDREEEEEEREERRDRGRREERGGGKKKPARDEDPDNPFANLD